MAAIMRSIAISGLLCLVATAGLAAPKTYPVSGKVVAVHVAEQNRFIPGYDNGGGAKSAGVSVKDRQQVYRVETVDRYYELEGGSREALEVGAEIAFRLEKGRAFVKLGDKEKKLRIIGQGLLH